MPCGCRWGSRRWSGVSGRPDLGGSDCGQQVPGALSVCLISHFLHEVIYLGTTAQRDSRGLTAQVSSYITTHFFFGWDGSSGNGVDLAVNTADTWKQGRAYCAVIPIMQLEIKSRKKKQELQHVKHDTPHWFSCQSCLGRHEQVGAHQTKNNYFFGRV